MAIVAGQKALLGEAKDYLLNPTIVGAGAGVGYAAIMHGKGRDTSYQESATTGAQWGFGLGVAGLGIAALGRFRQTKFTIPSIKKSDWNNMTPEQQAVWKKSYGGADPTFIPGS